ncbi:MAG: hypothetical protein WA184_01240, partial [Stellaceae bacterium]
MASQWDVIEDAARSLGVAAETVRKWRVRGVPGRYRLAITRLTESQGRQVDEKAFDQPPGPRRGRSSAAAPHNPARSNRMPGSHNPGERNVTPEDSIRGRAPRPFTGTEYVESLRDG